MRLTHMLSIATAALVATSAAGLARSPVPAEDDTFTVYGEAGDWTIYSVAELDSCVIERADDSGNVIQMGLTKNHKHGYIGVFTLADIDIKRKQRVEIDIDGYVFEGKARGIKSKKLQGDYSGGYIEVKDPNLATAVAEGQTLIAFPKKTGAFMVDLTGTKKAMEEGRKCNLAMSS